MKSIRENMQSIRQLIETTCRKSGRNPGEVKLVAVSKSFPVNTIMEAYQAGQRMFGENRVQELIQKVPQLPPDIEWHLIGTLQRNKVKYIIDKVSLIHSVDSLALAQEISKRALKAGVTVNILLQANISQETSKSGFSEEELLQNIKEISVLPGIKIKGLMTIGPLVAQAEEVRPIFRRLKELSVEIDGMKLPQVEMKELSMGMSDDFTVAVEEGATLVRIGSRIFGPRNYEEGGEEHEGFR
jgi:hypothetical protein